ncbi:phage nozzle protein, partial [Escherichia coli]|uniref:phage nozzle protein n=1 Tax=Escherichia coli TaxID=562 RepID=UPI0040593E4C
DDFTLSSTDSTSGNDLKSTKGSVKSVSDLPPKAPEGYIVRITGEGKSTKDDYWVKAHNTNDAKVTWRESVEPGIPISFNAATMPHVL